MNPLNSIVSHWTGSFDDPRRSEPAAVAYGLVAALAVLLASLII